MLDAVIVVRSVSLLLPATARSPYVWATGTVFCSMVWAVSPVCFISAYGASRASAEAPSALGSAMARVPPSSADAHDAGAFAAGPPTRPTGVWARTSEIGVPVQPAAVSWPFQVGLSGIQISGISASGSASEATTSATVPAVTWMSMQGSSALTSLTASLTRSSMTGAVVRVTLSDTQSAFAGASSPPPKVNTANRPTAMTSTSPTSSGTLPRSPERRSAAEELGPVPGAFESS